MIESLWATNEKSADYSFNKSHAACYALISYRTAWLKANYPAEYMAALISSVMDTKDKVPFFVNQAEAMGIEILPPDVNLSDHEFMVVEGNIRFGLDAVKGVGYAAVEAIKKRPRGGRRLHVAVGLLRARGRPHGQQALDRGADQVRRVRLHGRDPQGHARVLDSAQAAGQRAQQDAQMGQGSIFDLFDAGPAATRAPFTAPTLPADPDRRVRAHRAAGDGEGVDRHLHLRAPAQARARGAEGQGRLLDRPGIDQRDGEWVKVGGMITESKKIRTRAGSTMMFATLDDLDGSVEIVVFEKALAAAESVIADDAIVIVRGRVDHKEAGKVCVIVQDVDEVRPVGRRDREGQGAGGRAVAAPRPRRCKRRVDAAQLPATVIDDLRELFERYPGETEFVLEMHTRTGLRRLSSATATRSRRATPACKAELDALLGPRAAAAARDGRRPGAAAAHAVPADVRRERMPRRGVLAARSRR